MTQVQSQPAAAAHTAPAQQRQVDVVVVGAGVTGLVAATEAARAGKSVAVLEARDRVGGRLWTDEVDGVELELGGQWVSPDQSALLETISDLGLETFPRHRSGTNVYVDRDRRRHTFEGATFPVPSATADEMDRMTVSLDELAGRMDPMRPWDHPDAEALDRMTFASWLDAQSDDCEAKDNIGLYIGPAMLTKQTHEFSALSAVLMAASAGGFSNLVDADHILDRRVIGGLQQLPIALAAQLGDAVFTGCPVERIDWTASGALVATASSTWQARHVVVAVPPTLVQRIRFAPNLPATQMQWRQHQSFGLVIKLHVTYDTPFWRDMGLSGTAFSPYEVVHEAYDNTNYGETRGTLVGFASDRNADSLLALSSLERRARVLEALATYFGEQARQPSSYFESQWMTEEWTAGAYGTSFGLGGLTRFGATINDPVGPIVFGTSDVPGPGFQHVDGAIRTGRRLARQVLEPRPLLRARPTASTTASRQALRKTT